MYSILLPAIAFAKHIICVKDAKGIPLAVLITSCMVLYHLHLQSRLHFPVTHQPSQLLSRLLFVPSILHPTQTLRQRTYPSALSWPVPTILYLFHVEYVMVTNSSDYEANITRMLLRTMTVAISARRLSSRCRITTAAICSTWIKVATAAQHAVDS